MRVEEVHSFPNSSVLLGDCLHWNVVQLWNDILAGLEKAASFRDSAIVSVGVNSWGADFVLMGSANELLGLPIDSRDDRTAGMVEQACCHVSRDEIHAATGRPCVPSSSLYQLMVTRQTTPRLLEMADCFLMIADFFHWCLSGSRVVEFSNALTTQMCDPMRRDWSVEFLRRLDLPVVAFPEIVVPGTKLGRLRATVSNSSGVPRLNVVAPASLRTASAVAAVPATSHERGSWCWCILEDRPQLGVEVDQPVFSERAFELGFANGAGVEGTFFLYRNIACSRLVRQVLGSIHASDTSDSSRFDRLVAQAEPFRSLVSPDHPDFHGANDIKQSIVDRCRKTGEPVPQCREQFARCVLDSLALEHWLGLLQLEELLSISIETVYLVGVGSRSRFLNQLFANVCKRSVFAGPDIATASGNLLTQAHSAGELNSLVDIRRVVRDSFTLEEFLPDESSLVEVSDDRRRLIST